MVGLLCLLSTNETLYKTTWVNLIRNQEPDFVWLSDPSEHDEISATKESLSSVTSAGIKVAAESLTEKDIS